MKIIMTGGGSSGHVTPNFALMPELIKAGFEIEYIGSHNGIEKKLVCNKKNIKYHEISCGKLRRYWSLKNFTDLINIIKGLKEANKLIKKIKPNIIFSKGGFVSVPVVIAGWKNKIPIVIHESDITPGLANKISIPFASCVCTSFKKAAENISKTKTIVTGSPIRDELFLGDKLRAKNNLKLNNMPVILVIGGSLGSIKINNVVRESLDELKNFVVIHICGMGNKKNIIRKNYFEFEYIDKNLADYFCLADMIISRAGSNAIFELLALKKPNLLIPLSKKASRGDQILNAMAFQKKGFSKILYEENLTKQNLLKNIKELYDNKEKYIKAMSESNFVAGNKKIIEQIKKLAKKN